jgi:ATP phosphoribosyltransferase regulatory subunit
MIDVMLTVLADAGLTENLHLDLGHVAVFRALARTAGLTQEQEQVLFDIYQRKSIPELKEFSQSVPLGNDFLTLGRLSHDLTALGAQLSAQAQQNRDVQDALAQLAATLAHVQAHWPQVEVSVDATELRGYHYHTGLVFAVYAPSLATPLAKGGRYNGVGQAFGRARPATGFSCDLYALTGYLPLAERVVVAAPVGRDADLLKAIADARDAGQIVIQALDSSDAIHARASHILNFVDDRWQVQPR